jgi:ectoine hydroxylase-related dioxygenase (phytanoyl-CoA dioxygenase family)
MEKKPVFSDLLLQKKFDTDGFVKIPFLNVEEMRALVNCYERFEVAHSFDEGGFHHTTHHTKNWRLLEQVNKALLNIFQPKIASFFVNIATLAANFIIKDNGADTEFVPHQDWTLLDEKSYYSFNIWIPLHPVNEKNGAIRILKGSQNLLRSIRCAPSFPRVFENVMPHVYENLTTITFEYGEAVVFDCGVLHGSFPNLSEQKRVNAIVGLYSNDAQFKFYYNTEQGNPPLIEEYHINPDEFLTFAVGDRPVGRKPDRIFPYEFPVLTEAQFLEHYPLKI